MWTATAHPGSSNPREEAPHASRLGPAFEMTKRAVDILVALLALVLTAPLVACCALWIKLTDGGPVFYHQWRVGRDGWLFRIRKLRTMTLDAESDGARFASVADPRVLPGCGWMRRSHVDELPQLINILGGSMSLVGPRPERPELMEQLRRDLPDIDKRLACAPGLTGLAQVRNGYTNDVEGAKRKLAFDLEYLHRRSVTQDVRLMLATIPKVWDRAAC